MQSVRRSAGGAKRKQDSTEPKRPTKRLSNTRKRENNAEIFFITNEKRRFWYEITCDTIARAESYFPYDKNQRIYTATHPLITKLQKLIRGNRITCALCLVGQTGCDDADTHQLSDCCYQEQASKTEAHTWLAVFREYKAQGDGPGARCEHCKFPSALCWRSLHRDMLDERHGSEGQAREKTGGPYPAVLCNWVKPIQEFVAACMVSGGKMRSTGVSFLGATVLHRMGWEDWVGLVNEGPSIIRPWLEEMDDIQGFRCPRLLKLYGLLAVMEHPDAGVDFGLGMEEEI